jgi:hypothetical protein
MKIGKYIPLGEYNSVKIGYGTVDHKNLKTVYLKFNSWLQPNDETENYDKIIGKTRRNIKEIIYNINNQNFKTQCIVDLDIKTKGIKLEKRSFMNLEITLYADKHFDIKNSEIKSQINNLIIDIIETTLTDKNLFNFYKKKK